jgi:hypothetical protein
MAHRAKKDPPLRNILMGALLVLFAVVGYKLGIFNALAKRFVNHSIETMQQETDRQRREFEQRLQSPK